MIRGPPWAPRSAIVSFVSTPRRFATRAPLAVCAASLSALACGDGATPPVQPDGVIAAGVLIEGAPLRGATLVLAADGGGEMSLLTDEDGRARFGGLELGAYTLEASAPGLPVAFGAAPVVVLSAAVRAASVDVTGTWVRSGALTVRVEAGGLPVEGSTVSLIGPFEGYGRIETTRVTDDEGRVSFQDLVPGVYATGLADFDATLYAFSTATQAVGIRAGMTAMRLFQGERLQQIPPAPVAPH